VADIEDNVPVGRLTGRFVVEVQDNADPDQKAQLVPATGEIFVKASIGTLKITDPVTGKFITFRGPHRAILDDEGYLCTPYPGTDTIMYRDLVLWSNDSDMLDVKGWTYTATFNLKDKTGRQLTLSAINFELATDQIKDLADAVPTASSPGYGLGLAEQSALQAAQSAVASKQSAEEAQALAQNVVDRASAGEFDGQSAYEIWLSLGNTGTETDFMNWLKGQPGGFVMTYLPQTFDPDELKIPGIYAFNAPTTHAAKLPRQASGVIWVTSRQPANDRIFQDFYPNLPTSGVRCTFKRFFSGTSWSPFNDYPSTRIDKTVGNAVYIWDWVDNTERLVGGDTGWLNVNHLLSNGWTLGTAGRLLLRREAKKVSLFMQNVVPPSSGGSAYFLKGLPTAFRPALATQRLMVQGGNGSRALPFIVRRVELDIRVGTDGDVPGSLLGDQYSGTLAVWDTDDPWPTSIPTPPTP